MATKDADRRGYLRESDAAAYLAVSVSFFQDHIRPMIPRYNFAQQGAARPMWRYAPKDLDAYAAGRRIVRIDEGLAE